MRKRDIEIIERERKIDNLTVIKNENVITIIKN